MDWNKAHDSTSALITDNLMEGLTGYDFSQPGTVLKPVLAQKWHSTPDKKTWTFTLKKNILWNDGRPLKPEHFLHSFQRLLDPQTASEYAYFLFPIKNAQAYNKGKIRDFRKVGVFVNASGELVITLEQGTSYFPYLMAHFSTYPIRKDIIQKTGEARWTETHNLVTLGAYRLKKWDHDHQIILEKNPLYHGKPASLKYVLIHIIPNITAALNLFEQGRLDALRGLPSGHLPMLRKKKQYREKDLLATYYYGLNVQKPPFNNVLVRKAFALSIDKQKITRLLGGGQIPLKGWIPKGMFAYTPGLNEGFKPQKARTLLKKAGYGRGGKPFPKVVLSYNTGAEQKRIAENVQAQLKKNLNISVELSGQEWKSYLFSLRTGTQQMYRMGWGADFPDPDNFMTLMTSESASNHTFWNNKTYDRLVKKARSLPNGKQRFMLYQKAQRILTEEDVPVIPIYSSRSHFLVSDRVKHFPLNTMSQILFQYVTLHQKKPQAP